MKKILFAVILGAAILFSSCMAKIDNYNPNAKISDYVDFKIVAESSSQEILVDTQTGVLYYKKASGYKGYLTPLLKEDGTPKNIKDYQ